MPLEDLAGKLPAIVDGKLDRRIFVRGDKGLAYGRITEVMANITQGGFTKVALSQGKSVRRRWSPGCAASAVGLIWNGR